MNKDGGWIFISHSHLDIDIVRRIRNKLEDRGFEPLMFFLKCLNDDNEIESLIKREINERGGLFMLKAIMLQIHDGSNRRESILHN